MKKTVLASLSVLAMVPIFAQASDATVNFTGEVVSSTCVVNGGKRDIDVVMPKVSTKAFSQAGDVAGTTPFSVKVTGCPDTTLRGQFEIGSNVEPSTGRLNIAATTTPKATNVQIRLLDSTGSVFKVGSAVTPPQNTGTSGNASFDFYSQYVATNANVGVGKTNTSVEFSLVYN